MLEFTPPATEQPRMETVDDSRVKLPVTSPTYICHRLDLLRPDTNYTATLSCCCLPLPQLIASKNSFLSPAENSYFERLKKAQRRQHSYLLGRFAAKQAIVKQMPHIPPQDINIAWGVLTQPVIEHPQIHNLQVSISHTQDCAVALAFPEQHPMGIDIEDVQGKHSQGINSQVSLEEIKTFKSLGSYNEQQVLTLLWSIKEALSKLLKTGLMTDFSLYAIASAQPQQNLVVSHFKHWHQYKAISAILGSMAFAVVLPKKTNLNLSAVIDTLQQSMQPEHSETN